MKGAKKKSATLQKHGFYMCPVRQGRFGPSPWYEQEPTRRRKRKSKGPEAGGGVERGQTERV